MKRMGNSGKKGSKVLYIVLSILLACALWLYVRTADNPDTKVTISGIPVTFLSEDVLNANDLMVTEKVNESVNLRVQGKLSVVSALRRDNITISVDLSRVTGPGEYNLAYDITWPSNVSASSVSVLDRTPFYVSVKVGRQVTHQKEIKGVFTGTLAEGYEAGEFSFQPGVIEVSGLEADVAKVAYALVELNRENLDETVQEEMTYTLIGQDGEPVDAGLVISSPETVLVNYPVTMWKEVPLTVDFIAGGGATAESVKDHFTITPSSVILSGSEDALAAYNTINLGAIDLSKVIGTGEVTFTIPISPDVVNVSGVQEARVVVTVTGLETRTFTTENFEIINVPEGVTAQVVNEALSVQVRGTPEALDMVLPQYLRVVVDLKDRTLPAGRNLVTAKVILDGVSGAGVIGENTVSIELSDDIG